MADGRDIIHGDADIPHGTLSEIGGALASRPCARRGVPARIGTIRVVLVDDQELVRAGLRSLLHGNPEITVVAEASDGAGAIEAVLRSRPDVVVMDLDMPNGDGLTTTGALIERMPGLHVLIVSMYTERERLLAVLAAGARGYLAKSGAERELVEAIRVVASGEVYLRPAISAALAREHVAPPAARQDARARLGPLSGREQTVVALTAQGFNGPAVGRQLGITAKTVDTYKQRIEEKLGLRHRTEYVLFALQAELLGSYVLHDAVRRRMRLERHVVGDALRSREVVHGALGRVPLVLTVDRALERLPALVHPRLEPVTRDLDVPVQRGHHLMRQLGVRVTEHSDPTTWAALLEGFTERNHGRRSIVEVHDATPGVQIVESGYALQGAAYDHHDRAISLMLGDGRTTHMTRTITGIASIALHADSVGHDAALRIANDRGQTLLTFVPTGHSCGDARPAGRRLAIAMHGCRVQSSAPSLFPLRPELRSCSRPARRKDWLAMAVGRRMTMSGDLLAEAGIPPLRSSRLHP